MVIFFSIPAVQTVVARKVTDRLNETYGTDIQIERLGLNWKGEVDLRGVFIRDHHQDTLIYSKEIQTSILSVKRLTEGDLDFGFVDLSGAKLYITTYEGEEDDNLYIFTEKFETGEPPSGEPFLLNSDEVNLEDTVVRIRDENLQAPEAINFSNIYLSADDFSIVGPDITAKVHSLTLDAARGFSVQKLEADFAYTLSAITFKDLRLETYDSFINGDLVLNYDEEKGMADFNNSVVIDADFVDSNISTNDLNAFYNEFGRDINISLEGAIDGTLNDFLFSNGSLSFGNTRLLGDYSFKHLLDDDETYIISGKDHVITTNYFDLRRLMPSVLGEQLPQELKYFGSFSVIGDTQLDDDFLITNSNILSDLGDAKLDMEMGNIHDFSNAFYNGDVIFSDFNLGKLTNSISFGKVNANVNIDGRGFTAKTVNTKITGNIASFDFENYVYKDIAVSGNLKDPIFNGKLSIDDPNVKLNFNGLVDISKEFNQYDFEADIEYAELNKLNLFKRDSISVFAGRIVMDMQGTTVNDAVGNIEFLQTFYQTEKDDFYFDDFLITSSFEKDIRTIEIRSPDIVNGKISGKFLVEDIPNLFHNSVGSIYANYIPNEVTTGQFIDYEFRVYNKIVDVFVPQLQLGENTRVKGSVYSDESKFKLDFRSPEMLVYDNYLGKVNVQLDNDNPLYNAFISVDSLYTGAYNLTDINLINKTLNDTLYIQSNFKGGKRKADLFDLALYHTINPNGKSVVGIKKSKITYKDNDWYLNRNNDSRNKITFDNNFKDINLDSLTLRHKNELIQMAGFVQDTSLIDMKLQFRDVDIGKLLPEIDSLDLAGNINGKMNFLKRGKAFYPNSEVVVDNVTVNEVNYGDLYVDIKGNSDLTKYTFASNLQNDNVDSFKAHGLLSVEGKDPTVDLNVDFTNFNLAAFSPFGGDVISNIRGNVTGKAQVTGLAREPEINGNLALNNAGLTIPYLNVDVDLDDNTLVQVEKELFLLPKTGITDTKYNTYATLEGFFAHNNFDNWGMSLEMDTGRFLVLDTPPDDEALYYGTAFISGESKIQGPMDELVIDVVATTEEGTKFKIPISDAASISDDSFIRFISPEEKQALISGEVIIPEEVKGLSLNFELDINENAEIEVLVDQQNNSNLNGKGFGNMLLEINTNGKFNMWGDFLVTQGTYDFRYGGIVDKTIDLVPGGSITWDGNPTRARLDLTARYETEANPAVLLDNPSFNRKIPVEVLVSLSDEILQPELDFQINFPRVSSTVKSELEYKLQDKEQRQTQALFLVSTGAFQGDLNIGGQNAFSSTLTERVNKLVKDIFADSDKKFIVLPSISTNPNSVSQQTEYQVGVDFSTNISERILINGKVGVPVGGANESTVAGDIEVQWLVNDDGSLRINFFNRQADLQFIGEDQIFEQGAGVSYSVDFDTFKELMQKLFNKEMTKEKKEELEVESDDNYPVNFIAPDSKEEN
ncbi:translocation/assembly module TamB [Aureisphaera galaxeae]|uniref:translocation/assembly module TamB domain-containing protein n=1 Tax=Aureisphaera galaxeae TaxID=1538023 RepID=UPI00235056BE|nr:translocation/assembly module TamB domain-containing protein [Aureisphaera galaxeae]MDC8004171.1 translocation/assembly module TamB [Aureisphaera galaxeae]